MHIWAIGDLHLSFDKAGHLQKPMDIFGTVWEDHPTKIAEHWLNAVREEDWVLLAGDTSWALKPEEAVYDLDWLKKLPGHKVMVKGNHDLWWQGRKRTEKLLAPIKMICNDAMLIGDHALCGGRGYRAENGQNDSKLEQRELLRLENSLKQAAASDREMIVLMHYPPYAESGEDNLFSALLQKYAVKLVIYGHLHNNTADIRRRSLGSIPLYPVSADYLGNKLQLIV